MTNVTDWSWVVAGDAPISDSRTDDIWFFDDINGWLVNSNGQVRQTTDGGLTWHQRRFIDPSIPGFPYLRCMGWPNQRVGWIGSVTKFSTGKEYLNVLLHKTEDSGVNWTALTNLPQDAPAGICGMFAVSEDVVYGAGTNDPNLPGPGVIKTTDGGASWTHVDMSEHADNLIDVYFSDENTGWVVGGKIDQNCPKTKPGYETAQQYAPLKPVVLKTTDGGASWTDKAAGVAFDCGEWGWKIQWLDAMHGFVSLENFTAAAILLTTDGGETWTRKPIVDGAGAQINEDLEGIGFITPQSGWVGGWGKAFSGLLNSATVDGGTTWISQDNDASDLASDVRTRINRFRFVGDPIRAGYCSGHTVYKGGPKDQMVAMKTQAPAREASAQGFAMAHLPYDATGVVEISYVLESDANRVFVGIWNHFAFHIRTVIDNKPQLKGDHSVTWDGRDDEGNRLAAGVYICRMSVDGRAGESLMVRLPAE
ncbi:FlgD immunoglobulin-like domain containing protein [Mesorhizobium sp. LSJC264A00]|uniref:FlgD immunoglobulin-like domain containing protein n=1 Tax=unclassified Mesorhizobium TaxID=325217 RepID=UPI0003CF5DFA|nr:FlgD immunoglobulin-like domain containing protein [Mesorhizobium sp. LSJC264A00]ESX24159.1 hypothetical protein X767_13100 [Mesorhizobium sp. LSJC264A00]